jgi:hypothetical protein
LFLLPLAFTGCAVARPPAAPGSGAIPTGFPGECRSDQVEVMLLGTYHFQGSEADAIQTPASDILSEHRQAELEILAERLAGWLPDHIAVEWPSSFADSTTAWYQRYVAAGSTRSRNEVVQIGFRLAKLLGHATVYPIDHQMPIGNDSLEALLARRMDFQERLDSLTGLLQARADSAALWHQGTTVTEHLRAVNSEDGLRGGNSLGMFGSFLAAGEDANFGGPLLLARWYERNIIMVHNLTRVIQPESRRILVLVGSGHVPPLRNILDESPDFCPVSPIPFLN